jgi:periplasmic protein CpxP/Spy
MSTIYSSMRSMVGGIALVAGLMAAPALQAQGAGPAAGGPGGGGGGRGGQMGTPEERATAQLTQLTTLLTLTADQSAKVRPILVKQFTDQTALMTGGQAAGGDMTVRRAQVLEITTKAQTDILALLTDTQKAAYQKFLEEEAARRPGGFGGGGRGGAGGQGAPAGGAPPQ